MIEYGITASGIVHVIRPAESNGESGRYTTECGKWITPKKTFVSFDDEKPQKMCKGCLKCLV